MTERRDLIPLLDLQQVDERILRAEAQLAALPEAEALAAAVAERDEIVPVHEERTAEIRRLDTEQRRLEDEIGGIRARLAREQQRLESGTVTSPREITSLMAEIDALTRRISALEDDELEVMEQAEAVQTTVAEVERALDEATTRVADATAARDVAAAALAELLAGLGERRAEILPTVLPEVLERYERMRRSMGGIVVAAFDGKSCGGCGLPLSPAAREDYKTSNDVWYPCENCRRVLVEVPR